MFIIIFLNELSFGLYDDSVTLNKLMKSIICSFIIRAVVPKYFRGYESVNLLLKMGIGIGFLIALWQHP